MALVVARKGEGKEPDFVNLALHDFAYEIKLIQQELVVDGIGLMEAGSETPTAHVALIIVAKAVQFLWVSVDEVAFHNRVACNST